MSVELGADGSTKVTPSRFFFVVSGIRSAAIGAGLSLALWHWFEWALVPVWIAVVFGVRAFRSLCHGVVFLEQLSVSFSPAGIEGPKWSWLSRGSAAPGEVSWSASQINRRIMVLHDHSGARVLAIRMSWFSPSERDLISQEIEKMKGLMPV